MVKRKTEEAYEKLQAGLQQLPWILNGSAIKVAPTSKSANTTYMWTRKVNGKTVTVALSREQYDAFLEAINANRQLEKALKQMRKLSEKVLLESLPGVQKKTQKSN